MYAVVVLSHKYALLSLSPIFSLAEKSKSQKAIRHFITVKCVWICMCTQRIYLRRHYDIICLRVNQRQQMSTPLLQWPLYFKLFVFLWIKSSWISGGNSSPKQKEVPKFKIFGKRIKLVRIAIMSFPSASGHSKGKNKFLVTSAFIAMPDHVSLGSIPNSCQPLTTRGKGRYWNK